MANIKSDNDGFLIGEPLDLNRTFELWSDIRNDMRAVRLALNGKVVSGLPSDRQASINRKSDNERIPQQPVAVPQRRDDVARQSNKNQPASAAPATVTRKALLEPLKPAATPGNIRSRAKPSASAERDTKTGRFTKNSAGGNPLFGDESAGSNDRYVDSSSSDANGAVSMAAEKIANAVSSASSGMEETDPAIKAFGEVAQPMARGYEILTSGTGREQKDTFRWFRKIFSELRLFRKEETVFNKASNKSLKDIEEKTGQGSGGNSFGFLLGAGILAGGAIALLKKIPVIGALITSAGNIFDIYSGFSDDSLTNAEKNRKVSTGVGGVGGTLVGALGGAKLGALGGAKLGALTGAKLGALGGPITAAIGTAVGGLIGTLGGMWVGNMGGEKLGDVVADWLGDTDVGLEITTVWNNTVSSLGQEFSSLTGTFSSVLDSISSKVESTWNAFTGFMKDKLGIDIPKALEPAVNAGKKAVEAIKQSSVGKAVSKAFNRAESSAGSALEDVMPKGYRHRAIFDGIKGGDDLSRYGTYTDAEASRIRALKTSSANTSANIPGGMSQEIQDKISAQAKKYGLDPVMMQKIAAMESGGNPNAISKTGALGLYQFTGQTASGVGIKNRFDVDQNIEGGMKLTSQNMAMLKKAGLPVTAENIYMMHQLGPSAAQEIIRGSEGGKSKADLSSNTQRSMNLNYGANSKTAAEYIDVNRIALDKRYAETVGNVQTAHAQVPESPRMPAPQLPADEPSIVEPLASTGGRNQNIVASAQPEVGQDVKDRRIAHIVTGGLSN